MGKPSSFAFGPFVFHTLSRRLERQGDLVVLNSRATDLLLLLLGRAGELVTKDDLLQAAWGNRVVAENNLTVHMAALRRVLRTDDEADRYIRTEHGRGYRFVMPVETTQAEPGGLIDTPALADRSGMPGLSVLVMPVQCLPNDDKSRVFAAEVRGHLAVHLSRIPGVAAVGMPAGPDSIGDATKTSAVAEPTARYVLRTAVRPGRRDAQLVVMIDDSSSGATLWADRFEHRHVGLVAIESEIASRLSHGVITELIDREAARPLEREGSAHVAQSVFRGWSALNRGLLVHHDLDEARQWFERVLVDDPLNASAMAGLAYAIVAGNIRATTDLRASRSNAAMGPEVRRADELSMQAVARAPDWPRAWFCRGYVRLRQGRFEAALTAFQRGLSLDPCDAECLAYVGHVQFLAGRLEEMRAPLEHALTLCPRDRGVGLWHHFLGQYHFCHALDEQAIPYFVQGTDLCPSLVYPMAFLVAALAHAGRLTEARRTLVSWCEAMGGFDLTIKHLRAQVFSDDPTYLACHERMHRGLGLLGVPQG